MNPLKIKRDKGLGQIVLYALAIAALIFGLKWIEWNFLIVENAVDIYVGTIAIVFTLIGGWVATQLIKTKKQTVIVQKEVVIHQPKTFTLNQNELNKLNLTDREYEILKLLAQGHSNAEIAGHLFLSLSTIKTHVSNLYSKMDVKNRYEAMTRAKSLEIVE